MVIRRLKFYLCSSINLLPGLCPISSITPETAVEKCWLETQEFTRLLNEEKPAERGTDKKRQHWVSLADGTSGHVRRRIRSLLL